MNGHPTDPVIAELEALDSKGPPILSLYLITDTAKPEGRNLKAQMEGVMRPIAAMITHKEKLEELRRNEEACRQELSRMGAPPRSVALFCSTGRGLMRLVPLRMHLPPQAVWEPTPYLRPLLAAIDESGKTLLLFIDKQRAKLFRLQMEEAAEVQSFVDIVPRKHDKGGWEQADTQRHHDNHVAEHARRAIETLAQAIEKERPARIFITGPTEALTEAERLLPKNIREQSIIGNLGLHPHDSLETIKQVVRLRGGEAERGGEEELVEQLSKKMGYGLAVFGLEEVTQVVLEKRASLLAYVAGTRLEGAHCSHCGFLSAETLSDCPLCGTALEKDPDFLARLIHRVLELDGRVEEVRGPAADALAQRGGIAAGLRYARGRVA